MFLPVASLHYYLEAEGKGIPSNDFDHFLPFMSEKEKERYARIMELRKTAEAGSSVTPVVTSQTIECRI